MVSVVVFGMISRVVVAAVDVPSVKYYNQSGKNDEHWPDDDPDNSIVVFNAEGIEQSRGQEYQSEYNQDDASPGIAAIDGQASNDNQKHRPGDKYSGPGT